MQIFPHEYNDGILHSLTVKMKYCPFVNGRGKCLFYWPVKWLVCGFGLSAKT